MHPPHEKSVKVCHLFFVNPPNTKKSFGKVRMGGFWSKISLEAHQLRMEGEEG